MNKTTQYVRVDTTEDGQIEIEGMDDAASSEETRWHRIKISPDQVELLINHLKEAQAELQRKA